MLTNGTGIPGYTEIVANQFPNTTFAHYSSAYDGGTGGQTGFYNVMLNNNDPIAALSWWNGSCQFNSQMRQQVQDTSAAVPTNYRYYIGTGSRHTMFGSNKVYTDTTGGVPIVSWVNAMLNSSPPSLVDPAWDNVECTNCGLLLSGDPRPSRWRRRSSRSDRTSSSPVRRTHHPRVARMAPSVRAIRGPRSTFVETASLPDERRAQ